MSGVWTDSVLVEVIGKKFVKFDLVVTAITVDIKAKTHVRLSKCF